MLPCSEHAVCSVQDLASEETTASKARRTCFDDPRCTSFCYNCGARECDPDQLVTVYFKTYAEPKEHIQRHPSDFWHTHLLEDPAAGQTTGCTSAGAAAGGEQLHLANYTGALAQPLNPSQA